jgi:hypothetical protein
MQTPNQPGVARLSPTRTAIHPVSALVLIAIDNLWTLTDWAAALWLITVPLSFLAVFVPAFCIQKFMHGDGIARAAMCAIGLGVLAAIPTPVMGTAVGMIVLAMAGLNYRRAHSSQ